MSKTYKHIGYDDILNVSARSGAPFDRMGNALTLTNVGVERDGDAMGILFNGADSKLDCSDPDDLTGDISLVVWFKAYGWGESNINTILDNGKLVLRTDRGSERLKMYSNGANPLYSANNSVSLNVWQLVIITRTSAAITNFYINGVLSGSANQNGTSVLAGSTNIIIGNNNAQSYTTDGLISDVRIVNRILTAEEISQIFTNERRFYLNH